MKVLIVSDSHGHSEVLDDLIRKYKDVDIFLHAGDSEVPHYTIFPFRTVKGNCDYIYDMEKEYIIPTPFGNILLRHKDDASIKYLKDHDIKIYVFGHTHVKCCKKKNDIAYINPGSVCYPRDTETSYAILEDEDKECYCTFYDLETHKPLKKYHIYIGKEGEQKYDHSQIDVISPSDYSQEEIVEAVTQVTHELIEENKQLDIDEEGDE